MDFNAFTEIIVEKVKELLPEHDVRFRSVVKTNDVVFHGINITKSNEKGDRVIGTTVYIDNLYANYRDGMSLDRVAEKVVSVYRAHAPEKMNFELGMSFPEVKDRIIYTLINGKKSEKYLENVVTESYLDLTVVYRVLASTDIKSGLSTYLVSEKMMKCWGVTKEDLRKLAEENMKRLFPPTFDSIDKVIELPYEIRIPLLCCNLLVYTNDTTNYGATTLLYDDTIQKYAKEIGNDLYVIPSSMHELVCVPVSSCFDIDFILESIKMINLTKIKPEDYLSDSLYKCSYKTGEITIVNPASAS